MIIPVASRDRTTPTTAAIAHRSAMADEGRRIVETFHSAMLLMHTMLRLRGGMGPAMPVIAQPVCVDATFDLSRTEPVKALVSRKVVLLSEPRPWRRHVVSEALTRSGASVIETGSATAALEAIITAPWIELLVTAPETLDRPEGDLLALMRVRAPGLQWIDACNWDED